MGIFFVILLLVAVLGGVGAFVFIRRRNASAGDLPPPDIGELVDYTSEPEEEPVSLADRFSALSPAQKVMLFLVPLVLIGGLLIIILLLLPSGPGSPAGPEPVIAIRRADLIDAETIEIEAEVVLPNGEQVQVQLLEDGEEFPWFDRDEVETTVSGGRLQIILKKDADGPQANKDAQYTVALRATTGGTVLEDVEDLILPPNPSVRAAFFEADPTPTPRPTATSRPTSAPEEPTTAPEPTATPPPPQQGVAATVGNGGNVRAQPSANAERVGGIVLGDSVQVLQKTADGSWFQIKTADGVTGWAHVTALGADPGVVASVPVQGANQPAPQPAPSSDGVQVTVGNGGNLRAQPSVSAQQVGTISLGDNVQVLQKTADGSWFQIKTADGVTGWAHVTALRPGADVSERVPVVQG